jgi:hypothetical protein
LLLNEVESVVEVVGPRLGEVRTRDLRAVYGSALRRMAAVDLIVVAERGAPVTARVELAPVASGWSWRPALVCPACLDTTHLLLAREGKLQCRRCCRHKTRRQAERSLADFRRRGGQEEDRLLRMLTHPTARRALCLTEARRLVKALLVGDRVRIALLREKLQALTALVEVAD